MASRPADETGAVRWGLRSSGLFPLGKEADASPAQQLFWKAAPLLGTVRPSFEKASKMGAVYLSGRVGGGVCVFFLFFFLPPLLFFQRQLDKLHRLVLVLVTIAFGL